VYGLFANLAELDRTVVEALASLRSGPATAVFVAASAWWFKGLVLTGIGGFADVARRRLPWTMIFAGLAAAAASGACGLVKEIVDRARPAVADPTFATVVPTPATDAFPSGHATAAFAAAVAVAVVYPRLRWPLLLLAALVAVSRVYLGVHFPLDVVAGALLGVPFGLGFGLLARRTTERCPRSERLSRLLPG
jgi:undecaprenyl-diphosphatase